MYLPPFVSKISYAVLLSPLQVQQLTAAQLPSTLFLKKSNYRRISSILRLINSVIPGFAHRSSRWLYRNNQFPWAPVDNELIACGTGAAVFKLNWKSGAKVLRIYQKSIGKLPNRLLEIATYYKSNFETMLSWYGNAMDLVLPMEFMVLQGMPLVGPVAASLQPYVYGQKQDFFDDFSDDELLQLLERNCCVREQFLIFAKQTLHQWEERKQCFDFLGRENLMLVNQGGDYKLHIVDVGIFKFDSLPEILGDDYPGTMVKIEQRIDRLSVLYEQVRNCSQTLTHRSYT